MSILFIFNLKLRLHCFGLDLNIYMNFQQWENKKFMFRTAEKYARIFCVEFK